MNTHTQNHGFSTVIFVIIIAIIIGLLGFLGWRAWEAASKEPASSSTESTNKVGVGGEIPATLERISTASDSYTVPLPEGWLYGVCEDTDILSPQAKSYLAAVIQATLAQSQSAVTAETPGRRVIQPLILLSQTWR